MSGREDVINKAVTKSGTGAWDGGVGLGTRERTDAGTWDSGPRGHGDSGTPGRETWDARRETRDAGRGTRGRGTRGRDKQTEFAIYNFRWSGERYYIIMGSLPVADDFQRP